MSSKLPRSGDAAAGNGASSGKAVSSSNSWLDILKKVFKLAKNLIPLIKSLFNMAGSSSDTPKSTKDILTQLANVLPTGTFMAFQVIAPLATNGGKCGDTEKIVTGVLLVVFAAIIAVSTFTDSVKIPTTGKVYYGLVTPNKGLWNPAFIGSGVPGVTGAYYTAGGSKYNLRVYDFINAFLSLAAFAALSLLTEPVVTCFFKNLSSAVQKAVPLIVGVVISFMLSFAPASRNGLGFRLDATESDSSATSSLLHSETQPEGSVAAP